MTAQTITLHLTPDEALALCFITALGLPHLNDVRFLEGCDYGERINAVGRERLYEILDTLHSAEPGRAFIDFASVDRLMAANIVLSAAVPIPGGQDEIPINSVSDLQQALRDREAFAAGRHGIERHQYVAWLASDGRPRCARRERNGKRCARTVGHGPAMSLVEWLVEDAMNEHVCPKHAGRP